MKKRPIIRFLFVLCEVITAIFYCTFLSPTPATGHIEKQVVLPLILLSIILLIFIFTTLFSFKMKRNMENRKFIMISLVLQTLDCF